MKAQIRTPKSTYTVDYPQAIEAARRQFSTLWSAEELGVEKDEGDVRTKLTPGERHGLITVLKLFTQYELEIGQEFWSGKYSRMFPRPDLRRAANAFAFTELNSHAPFYDLINKTLNLATDEFYDSWKEDPILVERIEFVERFLETEDPYKCLAAFSFMEGVVLYSSFAFLKSFNMGGFNMIPHITSGVDISCKEEHHHFQFSAWTYRQLMLEEDDLGLINQDSKDRYQAMCLEIARQVYAHEERIVDLIFEQGGIRTVTKEEILHFIRDRINVVLKGLSCPPMFSEESGLISEWFYDTLSSYKYADFFSNNQIQYVRNWNRNALKFDPTLLEVAV
jgi:ribonucleotide reductase beta subunit family protein with ferritin-like domain